MKAILGGVLVMALLVPAMARADKEKAEPPEKSDRADKGERHEKGAEAASGLATGKRQHQPITTEVKSAKTGSTGGDDKPTESVHAQ